MTETAKDQQRPLMASDTPYQIDESDPEIREKVRHVVGQLYYRQFFILWGLTFAFYILVVGRDILSAPADVATLLHISNSSVLGLLLIVLGLEKMGKFGAHNIYLTPIPIGIAMVVNVYLHVILTGNVDYIARGLLIIMAFSVVAMLPWIFWVLVGFATFAHICISLEMLGPDSVTMIGVGVGAMMVSYGGFAVRYNSILEQARLNHLNQKRAEKLEQLARAKDEFIANMSHELRTPLTGLMGMVDLLDKANLQKEERHYLNTAKTSAETLRIVIDDILSLSKLGAGKLELHPEMFDPNKLLSEISEMMSVGAKNKGIGLALKLPEPPLPMIIADQGRIRQVLFNLLGNAVKFTDDGQIILSATTLEQAGDNITIRLSVEDTGVGIAAADVERLFERFAQVDSSSTRAQAGTGLGLAISSELAELMDTKIEVESQPGRGSTFWLDIEVAVAKDLPVTEAAKDDSPAKQDITKQALRVLIAEDNPVNQMLIRKLANQDAWTTSFANDGAEAVEAASTRSFDVILMDIQMPNMNGEEATQTIKDSNGPNKQTPIIALTANCMPEDIARYLQLGMVDSIAKPIKFEQFYETIARHVPDRGDPETIE